MGSGKTKSISILSEFALLILTLVLTGKSFQLIDWKSHKYPVIHLLRCTKKTISCLFLLCTVLNKFQQCNNKLLKISWNLTWSIIQIWFLVSSHPSKSASLTKNERKQTNKQTNKNIRTNRQPACLQWKVISFIHWPFGWASSWSACWYSVPLPSTATLNKWQN